MPKCPFCNHSNRTFATQCEKCKAPLYTTVSGDFDSTPASPIAAPEPDGIEADIADILELMRGGRKIDAIKLYRQRSGLGLKEAKDFVEALAAKHGIPARSGGCAGMVLLMIVVGGTVAGGAWLLAVC